MCRKGKGGGAWFRAYLESHEALCQVFLEVGVAGGCQLEREVGEVPEGVGLHHAEHRDAPVRWRLGEVEQEPESEPTALLGWGGALAAAWRLIHTHMMALSPGPRVHFTVASK